MTGNKKIISFKTTGTSLIGLFFFILQTEERTSTDTGEILLSCYVTMVTIHKSHWCVVLFPW